MVLKPGREEQARKIFEKWELDFAVIGHLTDTERMVLSWHGDIVGDIPIPPLVTEAPVYERPWTPTPLPATLDAAKVPAPKDWNASLLALVASPDLASKAWIWHQYDHLIMGNTAIRPQDGDAALVRVPGGHKGLAMTSDCTPRYVQAHPETGGRQAVAGEEVLRQDDVAGLLAAVLTVFAVVVLVGFDFRLRQFQRRQQLAGRPRERRLVGSGIGHLGQRLIGGIAQRVAPHIEDFARRLRRRFPRQLLPRQQRQRSVDRQLILAGHAIEAVGDAFLGQFGAQIGVHAVHELRANDFDTNLFERVVGVLGFLAGRHALRVHGVIVVPQPQRQGVGLAAQFDDFLGRQSASRQRQTRALAGDTRWAGLERHLHIGNIRHRAQHPGGRPLEVFRALIVFVGT